MSPRLRHYPDLARLDALGMPGPRHDDQTLSIFVENELKVIETKMYERMFPELDAREKIPTSSHVNPAAMAWSYDTMDKRGQANFVGASGTDIPRVDVSRQRNTHPIRTIAIAYGWTLEEIEAARMVGMGLDTMKADAARRAIAELDHNILLYGDAQRNLPGFLTNPVTPRISLPTGNWAAATPDQIIADLNALPDEMYTATIRVHRPDTMVLPLQFRRIISQTRIPDTGLTIEEFFLRTNRWIKEISDLPELDTAGVSGGPTMVAYQKTPGMLRGVVPMEYSQIPPQVSGFETVVAARSRVGGTAFYYPLSMFFGDGL